MHLALLFFLPIVTVYSDYFGPCPVLYLRGSANERSGWGDPIAPDVTKNIFERSEHANSLVIKQQLLEHNGYVNGCYIVNNSAICNGAGLHRIPQNLPSWIEELHLSENSIEAIENRSLSRYTQLVRLDLSHNNIKSLYQESFLGLRNLQRLNLQNNNLSYVKDTFPSEVFVPLVNLQWLSISSNNPDPSTEVLQLEYPANQLAVLSSLHTLFVDGLRHPFFGPAFRNLTHLTVFSAGGFLYGNCDIGGLGKDTFNNLAQVKCLYLNDCNIKGELIQKETFLPLKQLLFLDLTYNENIGLHNLPNVFYGLSNTTSLRYLRLHLVVPRYSLSLCVTEQNLRYFPQSVEYLDVQENAIESVSSGIIGMLPKGLKLLDLSGNNFVFGNSLLALADMKNLETLKLNGRTFSYSLPTSFPPNNNNNMLTASGTKWSNNCSDDYSIAIKQGKFLLKLPPNLKKIEMTTAGLMYTLTELHVDPNNALESLNLTGNRFENLEGPIVGLRSLKTLDLTFCYIYYIKDGFFSQLGSLETLNLSSNYLGTFFKTIGSKAIFSPLRNVKVLDLSFNVIEHLDPDIFIRLDKLTHLRLDRNLMTAFNCNISLMFNLRLLNLSRTYIATLDTTTRRSIDALVGRGVPVHVSMFKTSISCDCLNLEFLRWMVASKAFDQSFSHYKCYFNTLNLQDITDGYVEVIRSLTGECADNASLLFGVCLAVLIVVVFVGVSVCYRFRWKLRYLYHVAYLHYIKQESGSRLHDFEFDAFICYANEDQDFVVDVLDAELGHRGLKLYIHERDFVAGEYISSNIVNAVCRSRKTVVVLTPNMAKSAWCNYEIQMANMESVHTGRKVLVFLLKGRVPVSTRNVSVLYNIQANTYIEIPSHGNDEEMKRMWDKLAQDIRV